MATINATTAQGGYIDCNLGALFFSWDDTINNGAGTAATLNGTYIYTEARYQGGRSAYWNCRRSSLVFDTSAITGTLTSISLVIYVNGINDLTYFPDAIVEVVGSPTLASSLTTSDYLPYSYGAGSNSFNSVGDTWETITLNNTALSRAETENEITLQLRDAYYDYYYPTNLTSPAGNGNIEYRYNYSGFIPYLDYTMVTGYGQTVKGIIAASIGNVNGVAKASISKVIGV
jgi:hypothetical protein